jgi:profilin
MSWQDYVDKQLLASKCVSKACIAGFDGNVWAKSEGFDVRKEQ